MKRRLLIIVTLIQRLRGWLCCFFHRSHIASVSKLFFPQSSELLWRWLVSSNLINYLLVCFSFSLLDLRSFLPLSYWVIVLSRRHPSAGCALLHVELRGNQISVCSRQSLSHKHNVFPSGILSKGVVGGMELSAQRIVHYLIIGYPAIFRYTYTLFNYELSRVRL